MNTRTAFSTLAASRGTTEASAGASARLARHWPEWVAYLAAAWSAGYAGLAVWWTAGHPGLSDAFTRAIGADDFVNWGALERLGARAVAGLALASTVLAFVLAHRRRHDRVGAALITAAWCVASTLLLGVPDARVVAVLAYTPAFVIGAPFGWPLVDLADVMPWPVVNQLLCVPGGVVWGLTALVATRRARETCAACGRGGSVPRWISPSTLAHWGTRATWVAVAVPLLYAVTRLAWAAGFPLGITETFLREGQAIGMWRAGAALAAVAIAGAWLTVGLVRPWGEVFPRWIPFLSWRRVPPWLAVVPAAVMSCLFVAAGSGAVGSFMQNGFPEEGWGTTAPTLLWPAWGVALGAATLAYLSDGVAAASAAGVGERSARFS